MRDPRRFLHRRTEGGRQLATLTERSSCTVTALSISHQHCITMATTLHRHQRPPPLVHTFLGTERRLDDLFVTM
jgi:hypothetical protein